MYGEHRSGRGIAPSDMSSTASSAVAILHEGYGRLALKLITNGLAARGSKRFWKGSAT